MMRDKKGRFVKGKSGNPDGRPPKASEEEYRDAIKEVIPLQRFINQLEKLAVRADRGDSRAFSKICDLLGLNVVRQEVTGKDGERFVINLSWGDDIKTDND